MAPKADSILDRLHVWNFTEGDPARALLQDGWTNCSRDAVWATGPASRLRIPAPGCTCPLQIELTLMPYVRAPLRPHQRLRIAINGMEFGEDTLHCRTVVAVHLPETALAGQTAFDITLHCPDAISPADAAGEDDRRTLSFALWAIAILRVPGHTTFNAVTVAADLQSGTAPDAHIQRTEATFRRSIGEFATAFESLGTNCEFGLFQRRCHADTLGLLRFAGLPYTHLLDGIETGFAGIEDISTLSCTVEGPVAERIVRQSTFQLSFHTFQPPDALPEGGFLQNQSRLLAFRRDRLCELLATGEKLFVVQTPDGLSTSQALPLLARLRAHGPCALLFIARDTGQPAGSVTALAPGFYRGSLDGIGSALDGVIADRTTWLSDDAFSAWLSVCAIALWVWNKEKEAVLF